MDSNISVRFYRVERRDDAQPHFADCLENLVEKKEEDLVSVVGDITMSVLSLLQDGSFITGDLVRHQRENLPSLIEKAKKPQKLNLPNGGALGHHTAFRFDTRIGMLAYQMTRNAVSMSRFNDYVAQSASCDRFYFIPVWDPAELKSLNQMRPRNFLLKVADPHDLEAVEDEHKELRDNLIGLKEFAEGAYVKVQIGLGRTKGDLDKKIIRSAVGWLLEQVAKKRGKIRTLKLEGKTQIDEDTELDFLKAHLGSSDEINLEGLNPDQHYEARAAYLRKIMTRHSATLKSMAKG